MHGGDSLTPNSLGPTPQLRLAAAKGRVGNHPVESECVMDGGTSAEVSGNEVQNE